MEQTVIYIFITGLISFVPQGDDLWVLMRDAQAPQVYEHDADGRCIEPHVPLLAWDAKTCTGDCQTTHDRTFRRCDPKLSPIGVPKDSKLWVLDQETLTVSPVGAKTEDKTAHLATLTKVHDGHAHDPIKEVGAAWVSGPKPHRGLVARLNLKGAELTDCHLVPQEGDRSKAALLNYGYSKKEKKSNHERQPATDIALARIMLTGKQSLTVSSEVFGGGGPRTIKLEPYPCPHDGGDTHCLSLILSNQPPKTDYVAVGRHYDRLYDLSRGSKDKNRWIPYVEAGSTTNVHQGLCAAPAAKSRLGCIRDWLTQGHELPPDCTAILPASLNNRPICPMGGYSG